MAKEKNSEFVDILIPETPGEEPHNRYFSLNGKVYSVPVGITVSVPVALAAVWEESKAQQRAARERIIAATGARREADKVFMG